MTFCLYVLIVLTNYLNICHIRKEKSENCFFLQRMCIKRRNKHNFLHLINLNAKLQDAHLAKNIFSITNAICKIVYDNARSSLLKSSCTQLLCIETTIKPVKLITRLETRH